MRALVLSLLFSIGPGLPLLAEPSGESVPAESSHPATPAAEESVDGTTPLHEAVYRDETEVALALLASGSDAAAKNDYGVTVLSLACRNGNAELVRALLDAGAGVGDSLPGGETPLMTAARTGDGETVRVLLEKGAKIDRTIRNGQDALIWACAEGHAEVARLLLDAGADPRRKLPSGFTPLLFAARDGHLEVVRILLDAGADVGHVTDQEKKSRGAPPRGTSALRLAVENGHFELAVALIEAGADPDDQRSGLAPLHLLARVRKPDRGDGEDGLPAPRGSGSITSLEFARILVEKFGADVDLALESGSSGGTRFGTRGATPFLLAARRADLPYLQLLHELGADPTRKNEDGSDAFLALAGVGSYAPEEEAGDETDRLEALEWLLPMVEDIHIRNRMGDTAMHGAAYKNVPGVVRWLHRNGAKIETWNRKNRKGWTPLLIAQGFRPGNFKPSFETIAAIEEVMHAEGVDPPPAPKRPVVGKPKEYEP